MTIGTDNIEKGFTIILEGLHQEFGLDLTDENLKDTPKRIARAYEEIFGGIKDTDKKVQEILATAFPSKEYNSVIFCAGIKTFSMCPHHFLPVEYTTALGYIPSDDGYVLGASKLARIVELLSKRPVLQERLTKDITKALDTIQPKGSAVVVSGIHYCMRMRGVKQNSTFETSSMSGVFMTKPDTRKEFFDLLTLAKRKGD
uniref:GTP cyclohydrolase I n=1 Tax=viral metagenome TaxID=1070528 RepID=A0A6M3JSM8_9ZZZZ